MMAKQSRKALQRFADNLIERDIAEFTPVLSPLEQISYDRQVQEGYLGTPSQWLKEQRASTDALVKRLEAAEKDVVPNQIQDLRDIMEERHIQLLDEFKKMTDEIRELRELVVIALARAQRSQRGEDDDDRGELIGHDLWDSPIYRKRDHG
jgi:hypothetical protein